MDGEVCNFTMNISLFMQKKITECEGQIQVTDENDSNRLPKLYPSSFHGQREAPPYYTQTQLNVPSPDYISFYYLFIIYVSGEW